MALLGFQVPKLDQLLLARCGCRLGDGYRVGWPLSPPQRPQVSTAALARSIPSLQPLFPGTNELDQISRIHEVLGTPTEKTLSKFKQ